MEDWGDYTAADIAGGMDGYWGGGWQGSQFVDTGLSDGGLSGVSSGGGGGGSWLSDVGRVLSSGSVIGGLLTGGGALMAANANSGAAQQTANAAVEAARINSAAALEGIRLQADAAAKAREEMRQAAQRGIGAIRAGTGNYAATIAPLLTPQPITLPTYRGLTTGQQIARDDIRREGRATLAASGLRGAGRAGVGALMDSDRRYVAGVQDQNDRTRLAAEQDAVRRAEQARSGLAQIYAQEGGAIANTEVGQGNNIAQNINQTGRDAAAGTAAAASATAGGLTSSTNALASADLANSQLYGSALGSLGSILANGLKDENRDKYAATSRSI